MAWTTQIDFVTVGEEVQSEFLALIVDNLDEDDVKHVMLAGDIVVATGVNTGARLELGDAGELLRSNVNDINIPQKMEWVSSALTGDFASWADLQTSLGI